MTNKQFYLEQQNASEWISVETRLPPLQTRVLVYWRPVDYIDRPYHREIITAVRSAWDAEGNHNLDSKTWFANGRYYDTETFITHWMPLPSPPEEQT